MSRIFKPTILKKAMVLVIEYQEKDEKAIWKLLQSATNTINVKYGEIWNPYTGPEPNVSKILDLLIVQNNLLQKNVGLVGKNTVSN